MLPCDGASPLAEKMVPCVGALRKSAARAKHLTNKHQPGEGTKQTVAVGQGCARKTKTQLGLVRW